MYYNININININTNWMYQYQYQYIDISIYLAILAQAQAVVCLTSAWLWAHLNSRDRLRRISSTSSDVECRACSTSHLNSTRSRFHRGRDIDYGNGCLSISLPYATFFSIYFQKIAAILSLRADFDEILILRTVFSIQFQKIAQIHILRVHWRTWTWFLRTWTRPRRTWTRHGRDMNATLAHIDAHLPVSPPVRLAHIVVPLAHMRASLARMAASLA